MAKNTKIQHLRTSTSGLLPNTTNSSNSSYIDAGEFAVNLTDKKVLSSNGSTTFEVGANLTSLSINGSTSINSTGIYTSGIVNATALQVDGVFTANSTEVYSNGNFVAAGNVSATYFIGDGTYLTGLVPTFQEYVFANSSAGINGYNRAILATSFTSGTLGSFSNSVSTTNTFIGGFITDTGYPNETVVPAGTFTCYIESQKSSGGQDYFVYYEVYKRTTGGTETLLVTSDTTSLSALNTLTQQQIPALLLTQKTINSTDRLVFKFYAAVTSGGTNPTITLYFDNTSQSFIIAPTQTADSSRFVPYTQATANLEMNGHAINAAAFTVDGNFSANTTQVLLAVPVQANGSFGTSGQVLTTNGTTGAPYWSTVTGGGGSVNTDAAYVWTNVQTFNANVTVNGAIFSVGNSTVNTTINGTSFSGTSNNSTYAFGKSEGDLSVNTALSANNSAYLNGKSETNLNVNSAVTSNNSTYAFGKSEGNLNVNSALTSNNSSYFGGNPTAYYTNATNITTGTLPWSQAPTGTVNTSGSFTFSGTETFNANVQVNATFSVGNATVNTTINGTSFSGTANNATNAFGKTEGNLNVNSALSSNNSSYFGGNLPAYYTNATNITTGTLPWAQAPSGTVNTSSAFTFNANIQINAIFSVGNSTANVSANSTLFQVANSTGTANINPTSIAIGTFTANATKVSVGNSTTNTVLGFDIADQTMAQFAGSQNGYNFVLIRNANTGTQSSADLAIYNDSWPTTADKWVDLGITSSGYSNSSWTIGNANDAYLYTGNSSLSIGANGATSYLNFFTGGTLAANERMRITVGGNVGIANTNPDATFKVTGTANISGNVTISGVTNHIANVQLSAALIANGAAGSAGQLLFSNGAGAYWNAASFSPGVGTGSGTDTAFFIGGQTVNTNYTTSATQNYLSAGPITVNSGITVTITTGSRWAIV